MVKPLTSTLINIGDITNVREYSGLQKITNLNTSSIKTKAKDGTILVAIDAGHGGTDPGAVYNDLKEKDLNLRISKSIINQLASIKTNLRCLETRPNDTFVEISDRVKKSIQNNADLFVSIHCNSSETPGEGGIEVLFRSYKNSQVSSGSRNLANKILDSLVNSSGRKNRGVIDRQDLGVLKQNIPAVIVECGFINNQEEASWIKNNENKIAQYIIAGITRFIYNG
jgi:N-acetylmuramoyl-L-alanine amidase